MRKAEVYVQDRLAGTLEEIAEHGYLFSFSYLESYVGPPVSLTMPTQARVYSFKEFPPFFEGLLPEGPQLDALLRQEKIDRTDYFGQLAAVGADLVGDVNVRSCK